MPGAFQFHDENTEADYARAVRDYGHCIDYPKINRFASIFLIDAITEADLVGRGITVLEPAVMHLQVCQACARHTAATALWWSLLSAGTPQPAGS